MKRNAIIRIIIWSVVLLLLVSILGASLVGSSYLRRRNTAEATMIPQPVSTEYIRPENAITGTVINNLNIRSAPNEDATPLGMLIPGDTVDITRQEQVNGQSWGYIVLPQQGWIRMDYVTLGDDADPAADASIAEETIPENTTVTEAAAAGAETIAAAEAPAVSPVLTFPELEIEWVAGNITLEPSDVSDILITETEPTDPKYVAQIHRNSKKISIKFCEEKLIKRGFGLDISEGNLKKDLTILIPRNWALGTLEIDAAAASINVKNLVIREVEFDGASGNCDFENCVVDQLDLDTASGDVTFTGSLKTLDCDAASANVEAILDNVPDQIDMDSMSGDLKLTLPDWAGFTVTMDAMSSDFISEFNYAQTPNGAYVSGDGHCRIDMDAMSGDIYLYKQASAGAFVQSTTPAN